MEIYVLCVSCTHVFRLKYEPSNPDNWWCEECFALLTQNEPNKALVEP